MKLLKQWDREAEGQQLSVFCQWQHACEWVRSHFGLGSRNTVLGGWPSSAAKTATGRQAWMPSRTLPLPIHLHMQEKREREVASGGKGSARLPLRHVPELLLQPRRHPHTPLHKFAKRAKNAMQFSSKIERHYFDYVKMFLVIYMEFI